MISDDKCRAPLRTHRANRYFLSYKRRFVVCFSMTFVQAVANTKLVNIFSSLVATLIFIWCSIVDYRLGLILAVTAFIGAIIGARIALKLDNLWLRRIFLATVVALALKTLIYDFVWQQLL